jgi:16S rRNA (cytosine967-C5)-methyltransferase
MDSINSSQRRIGTQVSRFSPDIAKLAQETFGDDANAVLTALKNPVTTYWVRCNTLQTVVQELWEKLEDIGLNLERNPIIPEAVGINVSGPAEVPMSGRRIIVDKHTAESALQGANVYAPGIVDCGAVRQGEQVTIVSELEDIIASGTAMMNANEILTFRKGLAVRVERSRFSGPRIRELDEFSQGLLYPQSLAAMTTVRVLDPKPNEIIVDATCAPGGKLSHISQLMENSGKVFGFDRNLKKIQQTRVNLTRLGCRNVVLSIHDSRYLDKDFQDLKPDRVLIDPPCSALGIRPKMYDITNLERITRLSEYQKQFIKSVSKIVKPGGTIVYSVCTFAPQECEEVVKFAETDCALRVVAQSPMIGSRGFTRFGESASHCQRFHPHTHEIGYFIAKFQR